MVSIERASPHDFQAVAALDRVAWRINRNGEFIPDGEHVWRVWCEHALTFVARVAGEIAGVIVAFPSLDGRLFLHKVFVAEGRRGQGVGTQLFKSLMAEADRRGAAVFLTVDPANERALRLYARFGFTQREFVRGYYRDSEDRFVLCRPPARDDPHE